VSLSRGHLTTVVRRKTGRTVQEWIAERRMAEARRLLAETDLAVEEVGRRVGYCDPGYFVRTFRRAHGATPPGWRRAGARRPRGVEALREALRSLCAQGCARSRIRTSQNTPTRSLGE